MGLITIPKLEFDFETGTVKKSIADHVSPFPDRYSKKWGNRPAWIGISPDIVAASMPDGQDVLTYVFSELRRSASRGVPAIDLSSPPSVVRAASKIAEVDKRGVAITIKLEQLMAKNPESTLASLVSELRLAPRAIDLVVDLRAPGFEPLRTFASLLTTALSRIRGLREYRSLVIASCAFPDSLATMGQGGTEIPRYDWLLFRMLQEMTGDSSPRLNFGDYTVVHPDFKLVDMRAIKPAGKIVYAGPDSWLIQKGGAFRDDPSQMYEHSKAIVASPYFYGADFSYGDAFIEACARGEDGPSNLSKWKQVAINHHITVTTEQLATHHET